MKPHQERVVKEKKELDNKLSRLKLFIASATFLTLHGNEQSLLAQQASTMTEYSDILRRRIELFR